MKIYSLRYFDASDWRTNLAEVLAESGEHAKDLLLADRDTCVFKKGYHEGDALKAPNEVKRTWIEVMDSRDLPSIGVLSVRGYYD